MEIFSFVALAIGGFFGGFFGAAVGSAGLVSLPILLLLGFSPHVAIGTTRPAAAVLEFMSALRYWRDGVLTTSFLKRGIFLGLAGAVGSITGAILIAGVSDQTLRILLALIIFSMMIFTFMNRHWGMQEHPEKQRRYLLLTISTAFAGLYAGLFGFTFGTLITVILTGFGYTLLQGAALGRVIGTITSIAAAIVFAWQGYVDLPSTIVLSFGFGLGGWFGAGTASRGGNRYVKMVLVIVVLCSVLKLLFDFFSAAEGW